MRASGRLEDTVRSLHVPARSTGHQPGWALYGVLLLRDPELAVSSARAAVIAGMLARSMGVEAGAGGFWGFLLHDIGTLETPESILGKGGPLSTSEQGVVGVHTLRSAQLLEQPPGLEDAVPVALHHHERWDGTGYPSGLAGEEIPYGARLLAVADAFVAMTSPRPYRPACSAPDSAAVVVDGAGTQFDPNVTAEFEALAPSIAPALAGAPDLGLLGAEVLTLAERSTELSRAQLEAMFATALGLDAEQAADRFGRSPGTQRNWTSSLRRTLGCPARLPLPKFLAGAGRRSYEAVASRASS